MSALQPISILIGALGGEGGGVLARWLVQAASACSYPVQLTSIPGVAQRTGATTYYLEIVPVTRERLNGKEVALALSPVPGQVDLFVASELVEAGRAVQAGTVSPDRTIVIASSHRTYTVVEKSAMGDGRFDGDAISAALRKFSQRAILFDMNDAAKQSGTVISAVMLGAIAGSERLPISKSTFEEAIRGSGKGADASLKGFMVGFASVRNGNAPTLTLPRSGDVQGSTKIAGAQVLHRDVLMSRAQDAQERRARSDQEGMGGGRERASSEITSIIDRFKTSIPENLRFLLNEGQSRLVDYQNQTYADLYLSRVQRIFDIERMRHSAGEFPVTAAFARFLALWMSYEDVIRVADLKSRYSRRERVYKEVGAKADDVVRIIEYMKPGIDEWCALLPTRLAPRLRRWAERRGDVSRFNIGLHIRTTSIHGFLLLRGLASLRWWRPRTSRFAEEQRLIERWQGVIADALHHDHGLALELALCGRLIKGYGETHARGKANFLRILDTLLDPAIGSAAERASAIATAREAALADPEGRKLEQSLSAHGIAPLPPKPRPIVWHKRAPVSANR